MDWGNIILHVFAGFGAGTAASKLADYGSRSYDRWKTRRK